MSIYIPSSFALLNKIIINNSQIPDLFLILHVTESILEGILKKGINIIFYSSLFDYFTELFFI